MFALIDCNSFFSSCEKLFRPDLRDRPVVVLSNNDGCIISMSPEAKALGIPTGGPLHEWRDMIQQNNVTVFSSNYPLYGNLSTRVMMTLDKLTPDLTTYSIDEAFMDLSFLNPSQLRSYGMMIRDKVFRDTGIPVSVGIGKTKVLSKIANRLAKKYSADHGVLILNNDNTNEWLAGLPIEEVWGIGYRSAPKLKALGIKTALDFKSFSNTKLIRHTLSVRGEKIQNEMREESCIDLADFTTKKHISSTRSFGRKVTELSELKEAISVYITQAAEKLRMQKSSCQGLMIYLRTGTFTSESYSRNYAETHFSIPTHNTNDLVRAGIKLLEQIYKRGLEYKKAGVFLSDLSAQNQKQLGLFEESNPQSEKLMNVMDEINKRFKRQSVYLASCGSQRPWKMRSEIRSSRTQTSWHELMEVSR